MPRKKREKITPAISIAKKMKSVLGEVVKSHAKTNEQKQELGKALGQSLSSIQHLAYLNKGSFETVVGSVLHVTEMDQMDDEAIENFVHDFKEFFRTKLPSRESDKLWLALDQKLSEDEKVFWVSMLTAKVDLEEELRQKKKRRNRKSK